MGSQLNMEQSESKGLAEVARTQTHRVICSPGPLGGADGGQQQQQQQMVCNSSHCLGTRQHGTRRTPFAPGLVNPWRRPASVSHSTSLP